MNRCLTGHRENARNLILEHVIPVQPVSEDRRRESATGRTCGFGYSMGRRRQRRDDCRQGSAPALSDKIAHMSSPAQLVAHLRASSRLSLRALAERSGTSSATLSNYEQGTKEPRLSTLERLASAAGARLDVRILPDLARSLRGRGSAAATATNVLRAVESGEDGVAFRSCLELFEALRTVPSDGVRLLTVDAPILTGDERYDALIAAVVEDCCVNRAVATPPWVYEPQRSVQPWYVAGLNSLRADADRETPPVFRRHGVMILAQEFARA